MIRLRELLREALDAGMPTHHVKQMLDVVAKLQGAKGRL